MKILIVNTSDIEGGAARAAYRLHKSLLSLHVESQMLVQNKVNDYNVPVKKDQILRNFYSYVVESENKTQEGEAVSRKRKTYSPDFKAKVLLGLLKWDKTVNEIASKYEMLPNGHTVLVVFRKK